MEIIVKWLIRFLVIDSYLCHGRNHWMEKAKSQFHAHTSNVGLFRNVFNGFDTIANTLYAAIYKYAKVML